MALAFVMTRRSQVPAEDSPAFGAIAERFRRAGELERAASLCQEGLLKFPEHLSARVTLGWALLDLGKHKEARTELERVIKRAPDNLAAIRGLAELHDHMENADASDLHGPDWLPVEEMPVTEATAGPEFHLAPDLVTPQDALFFEEDLQSRLPFEAPLAIEAVPSFGSELERFMRAIGPPVVVIVEDETVIDLPVFEVIEGEASEAAARAAVVKMAVRHEACLTPTPALAALERFLRRVETRKLEGRFASVAS